MEMMNNKHIFIDTNVLVYATAKSAPNHHAAKLALDKYRHKLGSTLWINRQIIREYLSVLSKSQNFTHPLSMHQLINDIHIFEKIFEIADETDQVTQKLLDLLKNHNISGKRVHDVNIVATTLANGITHLLTNNVKDFSAFSSLIQVLPL